MLTTLLSAKKPSAELKKMGHAPLIEVMGGKEILLGDSRKRKKTAVMKFSSWLSDSGLQCLIPRPIPSYLVFSYTEQGKKNLSMKLNISVS